MSESPARLAVLFGPRRGTAREVRERLLVGRVPEADLQLLDEKVSREHCVFERKPTGFELRDLGSRNGTWVNGERLTVPRVLQVNDSIGVGETVLVWEADVEALLARDGDSTLIMSKGPLGLTTAASAPGEDAWARAGKLLLESAIASSGDEAANKLALAMAEGLGAEAVLICRRNAEGEWQPWLAQPPGAVVTAHATLAELAVRQQRAVSVEHHQRHALRDEQTTSLTSAPAFVMCAPLVGEAQGGAVFAVRRSTFDSRELALATALAQAASPALKLEPAAGSATTELALIAESASMKALLASAQRVAPAGSTVLLTGESGSGKEMVARFLHQHSKRVRGPFIALNCGALPRELAESELFGHERGAFTGATQTHPGVFERAQGGTLFLDEVGELLPELQVKLLRVLEERLVWRLGARVPTTIDVRLVAATNRELELDVKEKKFRADLFWRLNVVRLTLEPLRARRDDLAPLTTALIARHARSLGRATTTISADAMKALARCDWPGNVRQLSNAIERALVLKADDGPIDLSDLPPELLGGPGPANVEDHGGPRTLAERIAQVEREQIVLAMQRARGVKAQAATELGISRPTLDRKLEEYDIDWVAESGREPGK